MFYRKFADEGDNPVDNPNIYNVEENNRLSPSLQLFYRISIYRRYLWILITMPRGKADAQQSLPGSGESNGSFSSIESKELLYFYSNFSNTDEVYCKIKKYSYNYIDKLPGSKGFHLYKCCVFFIFILSYQREWVIDILNIKMIRSYYIHISIQLKLYISFTLVTGISHLHVDHINYQKNEC